MILCRLKDPAIQDFESKIKAVAYINRERSNIIRKVSYRVSLTIDCEGLDRITVEVKNDMVFDV